MYTIEEINNKLDEIVNKVYNYGCTEFLKDMPDNFFDSVVTDPPYEIGMMGKSWDNTGIAYSIIMWKEVLRVLQPGGHLLSFGGSRTYHRIACAIEDAGFEIRNQIQWIYSQGFPKSLNLHKKNNKCSSELGTGLKPATEPICLARKPISEKTIVENVLKWNTGGINIEKCRVPLVSGIDDSQLRVMNRNKKEDQEGWGMNKETGDIPEVISSRGRFPSNVIHDGSDEVIEEFAKYGEKKSGTNCVRTKEGNFLEHGGLGKEGDVQTTYGDKGSVARFFYCAKASGKDRNEGLGEGTGSNTYNKRCIACGKWQRKQGLTDDYTCHSHQPPSALRLGQSQA